MNLRIEEIFKSVQELELEGEGKLKIARFVEEILAPWEPEEIGKVKIEIQKEQKEAVIFLQIFAEPRCTWHGDWGNPPKCPRGLSRWGNEEECGGCQWYRPFYDVEKHTLRLP